MLGRVDKWVEDNQGKHFCHCGCGKAILINRNHRKNGIGKYIVGHSGRKRPPENGYLFGPEVKEWIGENQNKHLCHCGCGGFINIVNRYHILGIPQFIHGHQSRAREYPDAVERFWQKVDKNGINGCWRWRACKGKEGYGNIRTRDSCSKGLAHRLSYLIHYGEFDPELHVLHKCDNPECTNPDHLFLGNHIDNMKDSTLKGRRVKKYTPNQVMEAVRLKNEGVRNVDICKQTGVGDTDICAIMSGLTWRWVTGIKRKKGGK